MRTSWEGSVLFLVFFGHPDSWHILQWNARKVEVFEMFKKAEKLINLSRGSRKRRVSEMLADFQGSDSQRGRTWSENSIRHALAHHSCSSNSPRTFEKYPQSLNALWLMFTRVWLVARWKEWGLGEGWHEIDTFPPVVTEKPGIRRGKCRSKAAGSEWGDKRPR